MSAAAEDLPDTGYLRIGVYSTDVGKPAPNARIRVTSHGRPDDVIEEMTSDMSGQTPQLALPAPPPDYSQRPGEPQPYAEYDISVELNGYEPFRIEGVQVLPGSESIQPVNLYRLDEPAPELESIFIPDSVLWGDYPPKIMEEEVKELPANTGFVVLPEVVVPGTVVVHNGVPTNASAQNYWVPYKDYIKNVASCEIYSTWPVETIKANVLAIISFTLNRVYTEWYRSKGYYFTITNSTQYDHAFVYGRNIFSEISYIVDEIFADYITKPNIRQPLFAQYCDGRISQCPYMTQWGSKDLGDKGYKALDILKNYYGSNVYLAQAEKVEGVPLSFPDAALTTGSTGTHVRAIQEQLNAIANNYPVIGRLITDGQFGDSTRQAVEQFQRIFNLPVSGTVDYATWYKISDIFNAVMRVAEWDA